MTLLVWGHVCPLCQHTPVEGLQPLPLLLLRVQCCCGQAQQLQQGGQAADPTGSRRQALQQRAQEAQLLEQRRQAELQYTQQMQIRAIAQAADPILSAVYQERGCGLLVDRTAVYVYNPAMDVTDLVIQRLNTALPSLSFNRLEVPANLQQ
jgi:outer membrane protein